MIQTFAIAILMMFAIACSEPESYSGNNESLSETGSTASGTSAANSNTTTSTTATSSDTTSSTPDTGPVDEDPCAQASCAAPPLCDAGCEDPCGCCDCEESYCGDNGDLFKCTIGGCFERVTCDSPCVVGDEGAECPEEDPCATVGCGQAPICGEDCGEACGCCDCSPGETFCVENTLHTCSEDGSCFQQMRCRTSCVGEPGEAMCEARESCDDLEAEYEAIVTNSDNQSCGGDLTCQVLRGHCSVGLGGCWYGVNSDVTQESLDAIADRWRAAGCRGPVCRCTAEPDVRCDAGGCLLRP